MKGTLPAAFRASIGRYASEMKSLYMELYHSNAAYNGFVEMLCRAWSERPEELRALDRERQKDPDWYKKREMLGMQMYVGPFAGNLGGVRKKLKYIQDCGVNSRCLQCCNIGISFSRVVLCASFFYAFI